MRGSFTFIFVFSLLCFLLFTLSLLRFFFFFLPCHRLTGGLLVVPLTSFVSVYSLFL